MIIAVASVRRDAVGGRGAVSDTGADTAARGAAGAVLPARARPARTWSSSFGPKRTKAGSASRSRAANPAAPAARSRGTAMAPRARTPSNPATQYGPWSPTIATRSPTRMPAAASRSATAVTASANWRSQAVTSRLLADSDRLADVLLERQRQAVSELDSAASPEEAQAHARWLVREFLRGIGDASPPSPEQIAHCREFGASRARQSLPASALVQGYHLAHRELWQRLIEEVLAQPGVGPALLADMFGYGLQWLNRVVEAVNSRFPI